MKKRELTTEETEAALKDRFHKLLDAANKRDAPAGAVKAFQAVTQEARRAGFYFWRHENVRSPLEAALFTVVDVDGTKMLGGAIPLVWQEQAKDFLEDLGHADAPPVEKTLIEHAAVCWIRIALMEIHYTATCAAASNTLKRIEWIERRLTLAQRRFTRAVESLAKVRALTAATRLMESRTDAVSAAKRLNNVRTRNDSNAPALLRSF